MLQSFDQDNGITSNDWHWLLDIQIPFPGDVCVCVTLELQIWVCCNLGEEGELEKHWLTFSQVGNLCSGEKKQACSVPLEMKFQ